MTSMLRFFAVLLMLTSLAWPAWAADTVNVYTAWPESLSQPIFKAYTAKTGVAINFLRLSTGELVARATAEKNNPRADVIWGAPGDGFAAAKEAGIIEPYKPASWDRIPAELRDREGYFTAVAKNTLVFMSNAKLLKEKNLKAPTSWNDLLDPAFKGQIQTADARTSGTALTRILSIYYAFGKDEDRAFDYQKKLHKNVQVYTKSGGGCDYMVMFTRVIAGDDGAGRDFDMAHFTGPSDMRAFFGCGGDDAIGCLARWLASRATTDADLKRVADNPDTRRAFLRYYAMRASSVYSSGAHDEWNIFVKINRKRTLGDQVAMFFDGRPASPAEMEMEISPGYEVR